MELQILNKIWKSQNDKLIFSNQQGKDNIIKCNSYVSDDHKRQVEKWLSEVEIEQEKKEDLSRYMEKTERSIYWGVEGRQGCIWRLKSCFCLFLQNSCNRPIQTNLFRTVAGWWSTEFSRNMQVGLLRKCWKKNQKYTIYIFWHLDELVNFKPISPAYPRDWD